MVSTNYEFLFRLIIVGDSGVGKTNFLLRFTEESFVPRSDITIGKII